VVVFEKYKTEEGQVQQLTSVIPATQELEIRKKAV
jgi:hypothetical protein